MAPKFLRRMTMPLRGRLRGFSMSSMQSCLARSAARGLGIRTVIDVGASDGRWSRLAMRYFPDARYLLIEANPVHEPALQRFAKAHSRVEYALAAAGDVPGEIWFDATDPLGGLASQSKIEGARCIRLPQTTVDGEVSQRSLPGPYLLKTDTHGYELPILEGARGTLRETAVIVAEAYGFTLQEGCLRFWELCAYLSGQGFHAADIADIDRRLRDGMLWQMDLFFLRADRPECRDNRHHAISMW